MSALLQIKDIRAGYAQDSVIRGLSMHVRAGEFACLLGPSGCGKTTVLRAVAGFVPVSNGEIRLGDAVVSSPSRTVVPELRRLGMVFQDYALFPHLTVEDNIGFGLRGLARKPSRDVVVELLDVVGLKDIAGCYPHELSGGQQQRVALARALAPNPPMILLDEPFSNLDVGLRERLGTEVRDILKARGITAVLVTHDQNEAFALADRIGVMCRGELLQWDTAYNLYHEPADRFIAGFVGQGTFLPGRLLSPDSVDTEIGVLRGNRAYKWSAGTPVEVLLRPDDVIPDDRGRIFAEVSAKAFKGAETLYTLKIGSGLKVFSMFPSHPDKAIGETVKVSVAADHLIVFPSNDDSLQGDAPDKQK